MSSSRIATATTALDLAAALSPTAARRRQALLLGAILLLALVLRLPTFARPLLSDDEAIYATTADAMRRGDVLYRDVVDHKPPAIYDVYLTGFNALGPYNTQGAHTLVVLAALLCVVAIWWAARSVTRDAGAALAAACLWAVFSTTMLDYDSLAANCELFLVCAQAVAFAWLVAEPGGRRRGWFVWLGVGVLGGLSTAFKYQGGVFAVVIAAAAAFDWIRDRRGAWSASGLLLLAALGYLIVPAFYVYRLWAVGGLGAARFWFLFNFSYVAEGPSGWEAVRRGIARVALVGGIGGFLPYAFGLVGGWQALRDRSEGRLLALVWLATSAVALCAGARFFGHYFHHVLPALCLLGATPLVRTWRRSARWRPALVALVVVPASAALLCSTVLRAEVIAHTDPEPGYDAVVRAIDRISRPDDRLFVWGNSPQVYVLAQRPMGTRFSFCNYMTGISPGTPTETGEASADGNELVDAWRLLFEDLDARQPRWLIDAAAGGWDGYAAYPLSRYPALQQYVERHYTLRERVDGVGIYERSAP